MKIAKSTYQSLKQIYINNPYNIIFVMISTMLVLCIVMLINIIEAVVFVGSNAFSIQLIIFNISSQLLYTGMMIGLIKVIFFIIDNKNKKIINIFNYFDLLPQIIVASIINYVLLFFSLIPSLIIIYLKYGLENLKILYDYFLNQDPAFNALLNSYINNADIVYLLLLIIMPLLFISIKTAFMNFYIIDNSCTPIKALFKSWSITKNNIQNIVLIMLLISLFNIMVGIITLGVGLLLTFPISLLYFCQYFRTMKEEKNEKNKKTLD